MAGNCSESGRSVTSKITAILLLFTQGTDHCLTEIARLTGLPISTAHRLTADLVGCGVLGHAPDGCYRTGPALRGIAADAFASAPPTLAERAPCVIEDLSAAANCRVRLGVLTQPHVRYIEKRPGNRPATTFNPCATVPAHPTALGRALLAFAPCGTVEPIIICGLRSYTASTLTAPDRFRRALAVTRLTRVAITRGEFEAGVCAVAVPVFGAGGEVIAAIELAGPDPDLTSVLPMLWMASRSLTREVAGDVAPTSPPGVAHETAITIEAS